jgi:cell division protein FtsL
MQDNIQMKSISLYNFEQKIFWTLVIFIGLTFAFYLYVIQSTIVHIVERKTAEIQIRDTESEIADLESKVTKLGQEMNITLAEQMGYREISKINYVSRTPTLTMR